MPLAAVENLNVLEFYLLLHDAVVWRLSQTEEGQEYLEKAERLSMTEPERGGAPFGK